MYRNKEKGFTLVELIVVLAILATLAAIMVPSLTGYIDKANDTKLISMAKSIHTAAQVEASEVYARGPFSLEPLHNQEAKGNYVSVKNIINNSELKNWGTPGQDWSRLSGTESGTGFYIIYNGFGHNGKDKANYHFKVFINENGKLEELAVCNGEKIAELDDGKFTVSKISCKDTHSSNKLYNFVVYNNDVNSKAYYLNLFKKTQK